MRRFWRTCLLLSLLVFPVGARQPQRYAAFVIDSGPNGKYTRQLLDGLYDRGIRATFLLRGYRMEQYPDILQQLLQEQHEVGCRGFTGDNMTVMSRRTIAAELMEFETLLPKGYPLKLFCPPGGCTDGVRQVAEARRLAILGWSAEGADPDQIRDGDLILLKDTTPDGVRQALSLADTLLEQGFELVTVSHLADLRHTDMIPGKIYSSFPPEAPQGPFSD